VSAKTAEAPTTVFLSGANHFKRGKNFMDIVVLNELLSF